MRRRTRGPARSTAGGIVTSCPGTDCGLTIVLDAQLSLCPRGCGMRVCRICREDRPHRTDEGGTCALPPGQAPKRWGYADGEPRRRTFDKLDPEDKPVRASTKE